MTCSLCDKPLFSRGWCSAHYNRWRRNGDPLGGTYYGEWDPDPSDGFWDRVALVQAARMEVRPVLRSTDIRKARHTRNVLR